MVRHLHSLRTMKPDYGWIHTLLEEAENERMHLMIALALREPSITLRLSVLTCQALLLGFYTVAYVTSPVRKAYYCRYFIRNIEEIDFIDVFRNMRIGLLATWRKKHSRPTPH